MKGFVEIVVFFLLFSLLWGCEKERENTDNEAILSFSTDSVIFDTLFNTIGTPIKNLRVINPTAEKLIVSDIRLSGGEKSGFRLNINGETSNKVLNLEIPAYDSIFVFIELKPDRIKSNAPLLSEDSIVFVTKNIEQKVKLLAWGQNFKLIKSETIKTGKWTNEVPYLVHNFAYVDSGQVLTIEAGTTIHFHSNSGLFVKGTLRINGTHEKPVIFKGDRGEGSYSDLPDQWNGIILFSGSHNNKINHAIIKNANIGLQVGTIEHEGYASVELSNSRIENMGWAGIWAMKSKIVANNCVISNARQYNTALLLGGDYQFYHTTFANYTYGQSFGTRNTEALIVSNYLVNNKNGAKYIGDMKQATFGNCIIAGNLKNELMVSMDSKGSSNYLFDHCLIQLTDTMRIARPERFVDVILNTNPQFINARRGNFELDSLSVAKDYGRAVYAKYYPEDINQESRTGDNGPDLGAYELIEKKLFKKTK